MKPLRATFGLIVLLFAALGLYWLLTPRSTDTVTKNKAESLPTVVSVQIGKLRLMTLHRYVTGYGSVGPAPATATQPAADAPLAAPTAGVVAGVNVAEGGRVRRGELIMTLNSASVTAAFAQQEIERQKKLYAEHNTSLKNLQSARAQLALLQVVSPLSGTVVSLNAKPGQAVDGKTMVAEVMDLNRLVVKTSVPESVSDQLTPGEPVQVLTAPPARAKLSFVSPAVDSTNGTVAAWARLPAKSGFRPGRFVALRIVTATCANCLAAPQASVVTDEKGQSVISFVRGSEAVQIPVRTGFADNGWVEVKAAGLKAGDTVVTVGAYGLPKKTKIQVVNP
ncbi:MAG: efflux RND transporter periplasmic adaptor subunit [Syntrophobacteraceae bacterium]|nr:efflux RND transporter periplasmic adaptor subunit [Syntrophobacteraceae bacterium]